MSVSIPYPVRLERLQTVDSTNLHARRVLDGAGLRARDGAVLFQARQQTGGVGRFGRAWSSPEGGLWCTLLAPMPRERTDLLDGLGLRVGVACLQAVRDVLAESGRGSEARLKWPNDVLISGRKVLGVLCEGLARSGGMWMLVGVGLNANFRAAALPAGLRRPPTTLLDETGREVDLDAIRESLCAALINAIRTADNAAALAAARAALHGVGEPASLRLPGGFEIEGTLAGLSDAGTPLLLTPDGELAAPPGSELLQDRAPTGAGAAQSTR